MPIHDLHQLPSDLPWDAPAYLLLDGVSVETLPKRLYEWAESPDFDVLYLETPWAELSDVSPCLISLSGPHDTALAAFVQNSHEEWGYLLFSQASREALLKHLRWLVCVSHPLGEKMLLRLADPAVMHALLKQAKAGCVLAYKFKGKRFDCGSVEGYIEATNYCFENLYQKDQQKVELDKHSTQKS